MNNAFTNGSHGDPVIDLDACLLQVEASSAWFVRRVLPLSIEQLRWQPDAQQWSIAECLDHLNLTIGLYLPKIENAIDVAVRAGKIGGGISGYEPHEIEALKLVEPPVSARAAASPATIPAAGIDPDRLVDQFHQARDRYVAAVKRAAGLDLPHVRIVQPMHPAIHSLGGTLAFIAAHERRHLWQAERVRNRRRFPRALFKTGVRRQDSEQQPEMKGELIR